MSVLHPPLRPYGRLDVPAATGKESADFDRQAIEELGVPQPVLMENAGRAAATILDRLYPRGLVVALVGAGNNGGDALVALRTLAAWGREVRAVLVADRVGPETVLHAWTVPWVEDGDLDDAGWGELLAGAAIVVDGMLGTGVQGAPRERQARAIRHLHAAGRPVLAMDIPSGVDAATGAVPGEAVRADVTVSFGAPKLGCLLLPGRGRAGRVVAVEIGFPPMPPEAASAAVTTPAWAQARLPDRALDTHKNAVGRLVVVAGQSGMAGAAILCVRAGLRAGAGLVQVCSAPGNREVIQGAVPEAIFLDADDIDALDRALDQASAVAVGPGLGTGARGEALLARVLLVGTAPVVVDADGLNLLAESRGGSTREVAKRRRLLLTPHPGEMGRLRELSAEAIAADRVAVVREAANDLGCAVILKGAPSLVAAPGLPVQVDTQGSSDLATAGMGDVLTGVCGGLLAQGLDAARRGRRRPVPERARLRTRGEGAQPHAVRRRALATRGVGRARRGHGPPRPSLRHARPGSPEVGMSPPPRHPASQGTPLGPGGEFDLIRRFLADGEAMPAEVRVGPGDDAAVLDGGWVVSTDLSVEDVHFRRVWLRDDEIGYRAAASALSDLAAMAARPVAVLVSMALPTGRDVDAERLHAGVREAAHAVGAVVVGGDVSSSPGPCVLDVVVLGRAEAPVLRGGASPGDEIWVTGALGASAAAVAVWGRGETPSDAIRTAFAHPTPRVDVARSLSASGVLRALVDLSDGLAGDAGHLAAASGVRIVVEVARVPVAIAAVEALGEQGALEAALHGGEDYELCFAVGPATMDAVTAASKAGVALTRVGRVEEGEGVWLEAADGSVRPAARGGFSHLGTTRP